jgi:hypothetical protein
MGLKAEKFCYPWMATYGIKEAAMQYHFKLKHYNIFGFRYIYEVCLMMYLIVINNIYSLYFSK